MPMRWLQAHAEALAELQAEEAFKLAEIVSVGAGKLSKADHSKVMERWRRNLGEKESKPRGTVRAAVRAMGLGVKTIGTR